MESKKNFVLSLFTIQTSANLLKPGAELQISLPTQMPLVSVDGKDRMRGFQTGEGLIKHRSHRGTRGLVLNFLFASDRQQFKTFYDKGYSVI
jgi:hypothetical protein